MSLFLFWLAVATLLLVLATAVEFAIGNRSLSRLGNIAPFQGREAPKVSVIVAARNEARKIEAALQSILAQDYPNLEFVVVDDRSKTEPELFLIAWRTRTRAYTLSTSWNCPRAGLARITPNISARYARP